MRAVNSRQYFQDSLSELVGIRAGLLVPTHRQLHFLKEEFGDPPNWLDGDPSEVVGVRAEEFQEAFVQLLHAVGGLPNAKIIEQLVVEFCQTHLESIVVDPRKYGQLPHPATVLSYVLQSVIEAAVHKVSLPTQLQDLPGSRELVEQARLRHIWAALPERHEWDGMLNLNDLFESETHAATQQCLL